MYEKTLYCLSIVNGWWDTTNNLMHITCFSLKYIYLRIDLLAFFYEILFRLSNFITLHTCVHLYIHNLTDTNLQCRI